jgi:Kef-type K+ transport system membrane component KefB
MLNLLLIVLGMAALTEHFGLSLALGAFLAGMLISETPYRHQVRRRVSNHSVMFCWDFSLLRSACCLTLM